TTKHAEARPSICSSHSLTYSFLTEESSPLARICPAHTLPCSSSFASLSTNLFFGIFHALAFIWLGRAQTANCRCYFTNELFVYSFNSHNSLPFNFCLNPGRQLEKNRM